MKIYISFLCIYILGFWKTTNHETYISISEIRILKEGKIELSLELIAHDFEYVYQKSKSKEIKSFYNEELEYYDNKLLKEFIFNHYSLSVRNNKIDLKIIGNEINLDGILIIYIEGNCKKKILKN